MLLISYRNIISLKDRWTKCWSYSRNWMIRPIGLMPASGSFHIVFDKRIWGPHCLIDCFHIFIAFGQLQLHTWLSQLFKFKTWLLISCAKIDLYNLCNLQHWSWSKLKLAWQLEKYTWTSPPATSFNSLINCIKYHEVCTLFWFSTWLLNWFCIIFSILQIFPTATPVKNCEYLILWCLVFWCYVMICWSFIITKFCVLNVIIYN